MLCVIPSNLYHYHPLQRYKRYIDGTKPRFVYNKRWNRRIKSTIKFWTQLSHITALKQRWGMFGTIFLKDGWYLMPGRLVDGTEIDMYRYGFMNVDAGQPIYATIEELLTWNRSLPIPIPSDRDDANDHDATTTTTTTRIPYVYDDDVETYGFDLDIDYVNQLSRKVPPKASSLSTNKNLFLIMKNLRNKQGVGWQEEHDRMYDLFGHNVCKHWNKLVTSKSKMLDKFYWVHMRQDLVLPNQRPKEIRPELLLVYECDLPTKIRG